jgi:hypothetical protein
VHDRFQTLVELTDGNTCSPPRYGPAAGALIEAYRLAGLEGIELRDVPEIEK